MTVLPGISTTEGGPTAQSTHSVVTKPSHPFFSRSIWQEAGWPAIAYFGAGFAVGGVAFAVCDVIWPGFYFYGIPAGPDAWRAAQVLSLVVYVTGFCHAFAGACRRRWAGAVTSHPLSARRARRQVGWPVIAYCYAGVTTAAFWVYSGMPMICH